MQRIIACITLEHDFRLTLAALMLCIIGAGLSTRLYMRTRRVSSSRVAVQLGLTGMIAGTTVWATHFLAMLAYDPPVSHAYDAMKTATSLGVAIIGIMASFGVSRSGRGWSTVIAGGALFGASISAMHYIGMQAYLVTGELTHDPQLVAASNFCAIAFGCLTMHRLRHPVTRYCWVGAAGAMILTVVSVHFIGMGAIEIVSDPTVLVPQQLVSDITMGVAILVVVFFLLLAGFGSFLIETRIAEETQSLIRTAALHDALTKLPNRAHLQSHLRERTEDAEATFAVVTVDIDRFRSVNARLGNVVGDQLLLDVAERLSARVRPTDFIARSGSDEFVIVRDGVAHRDDAQDFAREVMLALCPPFQCLMELMDMRFSIGTARCPVDGQVPHDLLQKSQYAMKQSKADFEENISHYDAVMDQQSRDHEMLVADLRHALVSDQLHLNYQPQNDINSHAIVGFEVLCRWHHPERGVVPPSLFIPVAEDIGLIKNLGLWVLREACIEAAKWETPFRVAVNVAPRQLSDANFFKFVDEILSTTGLAPERLELEITEATIIDDKADVLDVMHKLKQRGISIAMDDFGTGYSSLASLQAFPFDKIKIDRSFVRDVHKNAQRAAIVRSTLLLGDALHIPVLAEGIEDENELAFLQKENCSEAQGFYFGRPMPVEDVRAIAQGSPSLKKTG